MSQKNVTKIVSILEKKDFVIKGYFIHYGDGPFDWIYYSRKGGLYKLEGMQENGYFQWMVLTKYFHNSKIKNGQLILGKEEITRNLDTRTLNVIRTICKKESYHINGYFTNYEEGAFDWIYITGKKVYKLDGMDKNGHFKWIDLTKYFDSIEIDNYTTIRIGKNRIEKRAPREERKM